MLLRILFENLSATASQCLDDIPLFESLLKHVPGRMEPQTIPPESSQRGDALQERRLARHRGNVA